MKFKALSNVLASLLLSVFCIVNVVHAGIISDYLKTDSVDDDWNIVYQGGYGTSFDYAGILNSLAPNSTVALASSSSVTSLSYDLFASTNISVLQMITPIDSVNFSNGAYWYRNTRSVGFSLGANIYQRSADTWGIKNNTSDQTADFDISWHGGVTNVLAGWRSGLNVSLNSNVWQKYVLVYDRPPVITKNVTSESAISVPEPSIFAIFVLGFLGLALHRFKKKS